ncbi:hypothetical protein QFC22_004687 [Naganishia vaughanmartiniae]|uniref:Uncharacterized protein n=1 Tax=Naganishia vaughanmartiniae TaxID=1424756 RepID=A0ACC2WZV3_9TREE|nr:hypothetical protein QFC22_004687 [Naganishia vaughanmartiniae]
MDASIVRQAKTPKQQTVGRPRKDPLVQATLAINSQSKIRLRALEKSTRENYRGLSAIPEFRFDPNGRVLMPAPVPVIKAKKKKGVGDSSTDSQKPHGPNVATREPHSQASPILPYIVAPLDLSINELEKAYGGLVSDADEPMDDVQKAKSRDKGGDLPLPDDDDNVDDNDRYGDYGDNNDTSNEQDFDTDDNHRRGSGSELTESSSTGSTEGESSEG